ncbi:NACHT domain-containing protein [Streptomyces coacervatus]|uniref:serine protease n=1 Tax=Streptomyces coacervatus TaxID=647381 RepID=UPI0023D9B672|nr:serine protease [Streptomyces coacervatus]MDF2270829.1 NACHT domain-containing protein [Streptomyces coacervatus]
MAPERSRIAAVLGAPQGSGYLLTPRLVLTAGHVVKNRAGVKVAALGGVGEVECRVVWARHDRECDAALLLAKKQDLLPPEEAERLGPVSWGVPSGLEPMESCQAIGFPQVQRDDEGGLDTEQIVGTFKPGSRMVRARYVLDTPHTPPITQAGGGSPWAGMSGAALFAEGMIIGVVVAESFDWQHGRIEAVRSRVLFADPEFVRTLVKYTGYQPTRYELSGPQHNPHADFERRYAAFVAEFYSELKIFGLDFSRREHAEWPLDTAYLSLELAPHQSREHGPDGLGGPSALPLREPGVGERQRVEAAFARQTRILLRGHAGSGKTTLVQWLAVTAARQDFPPELGHLQGCLPFVLPLRTLARRDSLPGPEDFLAAVGNPLHAAQPDGWADQVLQSGRGLLLIDGVDEVQESDRERTFDWLKKLITVYRDCVFLVTTRPSAVADGWLSTEVFTELNLLPMNRQDVGAFLHRWHQAAAETIQRAAEREQLKEYERELADILPRKEDLSRLATNPLMCAMICALNRDRNSYLPQNRLELYDAALSMLLVRRDAQRQVAAHLKINESAQLWLLQQLAYWMIRNGHAEADHAHALRVVADALRSMPQVAAPEQAGEVLDQLLLRSGVLRAPSTDTVEFVHRTFQDYLGAKAAVEGQDLNLVAAHAHEPQWEDVVRMAVGHARADERAVLLRRLLELGDAAASPQRERLHLLTAACLEHATALAPEVRAEVERRAAVLVPPGDLADAELLAQAGAVVLGLLPPPDGLAPEQARAVVRTARLLGGEHAFQVLSTFRGHADRRVRQELADAWDSFDALAYAEGILAHTELTGVSLTVRSTEQLAALPLLDRVPILGCVGDFPAEALSTVLRHARPDNVALVSNDALSDLEFLAADLPNLSRLQLSDCGGIVDYWALTRLRLDTITLGNAPSGPDLSPLQNMETLRSAIFLWGRSGAVRRLSLRDIPFPAGIQKIAFHGNLLVHDLDELARWPHLTSLALADSPVPAEELAALRRLPSLEHVDLTLEDLSTSALAGVPPLASVTSVQMTILRPVDPYDIAVLRRMFPSLRTLRLYLEINHTGRRPATVDLSTLAGVPDVSVVLFPPPFGELKVTGDEHLPPGSVRQVVQPLSADAPPPPSPWWRRLSSR